MNRGDPPPAPYIPRLTPLKGKPARLTTIIALRYGNGIIMVGDVQGTIGRRSEPTSKLSVIGDNMVIGCAGSSPYIADFKEVLAAKAKRGGNPKEILRRAIVGYSTRVISEGRDMGLDFGKYPMPEESMLQGILSAYDKRHKSYHILEFQTPDIPEDITASGRAIVGSGTEAGLMLFRITEWGMFVLKQATGRNATWQDMSEKLATMFADNLVLTLSYHDIYTGLGTNVRRIDSRGVSNPLSPREIYGEELVNDRLVALAHAARDELGTDALVKLLGHFGV